jgi:hypothetical protein
VTTHHRRAPVHPSAIIAKTDLVDYAATAYLRAQSKTARMAALADLKQAIAELDKTMAKSGGAS